MELIRLPLIKLYQKSESYQIINNSSIKNDNPELNISNIKLKQKKILEKNLIKNNNNYSNSNDFNNNNKKLKLSLKIKKTFFNHIPNQKFLFNPKKSCENFYNNNLLHSYEEFSSLNSKKFDLIRNKENDDKKIINNLSHFHIVNDNHEKIKKNITIKNIKEYKTKLKNSVVLKQIRKKTIFNNELIKSVLN